MKGGRGDAPSCKGQWRNWVKDKGIGTLGKILKAKKKKHANRQNWGNKVKIPGRPGGKKNKGGKKKEVPQ